MAACVLRVDDWAVNQDVKSSDSRGQSKETHLLVSGDDGSPIRDSGVKRLRFLEAWLQMPIQLN